MPRYCLLLITLLLGAIGSSVSSHAVLYTNDSLTRRDATEDEGKSFLFMRNTAFLVDENTILATKHTATDGAFPFEQDCYFVVEETHAAGVFNFDELNMLVKQEGWPAPSTCGFREK